MSNPWPRFRILLAILVVFTAVFASIRQVYDELGWQDGLSFGFAVGLGLALSAALAWRASALLPWPARLGWRFVGGQGLAALVAAMLPYTMDRVYRSRLEDIGFLEAFLTAEFLLWELMIWGGLYGTFAGIAYAARGRQEVEVHRLAVAEAHANAVQAQLDALRGQLNPHFLYNALHSLAQLVTEDPAAAEGAIERMGDMLRYALEAEDWDVPLSEEWEFTQLYLSIERLRLDGRLDVDARLDDEALSEHVPRFTLQPLVENAIRHGISQRREGGTVRISADCSAEGLSLSIADDGPGCEPMGTELSKGTGLRNLRERLRARFGDQAEMTVTTGVGRGFRVDIRIPSE